MIDTSQVNTVAGAFVAGLVTSLHCAGMCGPLACLTGRPGSPRQSTQSFTAYQVSRTASYGVLGFAAGAVGGAPLRLLMQSPAVILPWCLAVILVALGLGLDKRVPKPAAFGAFLFRLRLGLGKRPPVVEALLLGALTPLLPCAPLYLMAGLAALSGSGASGAQFMIAFAMGTAPLLWLSQRGWGKLRLAVSPQCLARLQRGLALVTALLIAVRLKDTLPFLSAQEIVTHPSCPLCP